MELENMGTHRLAAKARITNLIRKQLSDFAPKKKQKDEICQEIIDISVNTNVISPFISFIGVGSGIGKHILPANEASKCFGTH